MESSQVNRDTGRKDERGLAGAPVSLWIGTTPETDYPPLEGHCKVDVAVLGGGIAGLTAAILLKEGGARVAVVESGRVARGVSGHTTAKITSAHTLIYDYLLSHFGEERARLYADANQKAIAHVETFASERGIACDLCTTYATTFAESDGELEKIQAEVRAAEKLGLPVSFTDALPLPFPIKGAIRFDNQAQFHPRKYLLALAERIHGNDSFVFEKTRALQIDGSKPFRVQTDRGTITAENVIVATHFPFISDGLFFARMVPRRSYVLGVTLRGAMPEGMHISAGDSYHSVRPHYLASGEEYLLIGGEPHKPGHGGDTRKHYRVVEEFARRHFEIDSIVYRWSTQDNRPVDQVPYIGKATPISGRLYVATGFKGWGMSLGTVSGMILSDLILGKPNPWSTLFDPNRLPPLQSATRLIGMNLHVGGTFVKDRLPIFSTPHLTDIPQGEGAVVQVGTEKVAAYKDEEGTLHAVSPYCTHMQCLVRWNSAEKSWDCPCHGSRFDAYGRVVHAPAVKDLEKKRGETPPEGETA